MKEHMHGIKSSATALGGKAVDAANKGVASAGLPGGGAAGKVVVVSLYVLL